MADDAAGDHGGRPASGSELRKCAVRGAANGSVSSDDGLKVGPGVSLEAEEAYRGGGMHGGQVDAWVPWAQR